MNTYCIINTGENIITTKNSKIKKLIPRKLYLNYIYKKLPVTFNEIEYLGEKGQEIVLPFTENELETLEENYIKMFLEKIITNNEIEYLYVAPHLQKLLYMNEEEHTPYYGSIFLYIMFPQIFEQMLEESKIDRKEMRLAIVDSGDRKIEYILELLVYDLNYLTIITKRPEYFNEFVDIIYDNTGLLIEIISDEELQEIKGNVVIDLTNQYHKVFNNTTVVLDMESNLKKRQYLYSRKKDIRIVYDVLLHYNNQLVNNELLGFLLLKNREIIREFHDNKNREYQTKEITEIGRILNLKLAKLIYL